MASDNFRHAGPSRMQSLPSRQAIVAENVVLDERSRFFTKGKTNGNQAAA
jgi:hypothetical protein